MKSCDRCQKEYPDSLEACPEDGAPLRPASIARWGPGSVIGGYDLLAELGRGRVSAVFKARDRKTDEHRALRVLCPEFARQTWAIEQFKRQAEIARGLRHRAVARIESVEETGDGHPFAVMECVEGSDLATALQEAGSFPPQRACAIARQVAEALDAAHRMGMLHRQLDPVHVRLLPVPGGEQVKVLGFGMARVAEACLRGRGPRASTSGLAGLVTGAPQYASPEQATGKLDAELDARSDFYSLGILLYQMLSGRLPYPAEAASENDGALGALIAHLEAAPEPLTDAQVPGPLATMVMRLLEKRREMRPATAQMVLDELRRVESGFALAAFEPQWDDVGAPVDAHRVEPAVRAEPSRLGAGSALDASEQGLIIAAVPISQPVSLGPPALGAEELPLGALAEGARAESVTPAPAGAAEVEPAAPAGSVAGIDLVRPDSVLFRAPAPPSRAWGRALKVALALAAVIAGVWSFAFYRPRLARSTIDSIVQKYGPSDANRRKQAPPPVTQPVTPPAATSKPSSKAPSTAPAFQGPPLKPAVPAAKPSAAPILPVAKKVSVDAALVRAAIAEGDGFFELGDYDRAVAVYERPLKIDPSIKELRERVERARKAKAAEEKYLGQ